MTVRTRFAPSPTGQLHLGNARIAVLNWLQARHSDGQFVLRIEDTDVERNIPGSEEEIFRSLRDLGLDWDEGPDVGGDRGPYRQSERRAVYQEHARRMLESGTAYRCYCTPAELERRKVEAQARGAQPRYDGRCRDLGPADEGRLRAQGVAASIRFAVTGGAVVVEDAVRGSIGFPVDEFGDFVIVKSDGLPTYNFAVVVDDISMAISHVIRGAGHLANTPRQVMLYAALDHPPPVFVHIPHVLGPDGGPLSKRYGARSLAEYLSQGYHPEAIINYLSLLSWSSPSGDEVLPKGRLIDEIDLARIGSSDVRLDPDKLEWLSGEYIRGMSAEALAERLAKQLGTAAFPGGAHDRVRIAAALRQRITTFAGAARFLPQFYPPNPMEWEPEALEQLSQPGAGAVVAAVLRALRDVEPWNGARALDAVREAGKGCGARGRALYMPLRAALTGSTQGPELADVLEVQGKTTALRVLEQACSRGGQG